MRRCQVVGPLEPLVSSVTPREILVDVIDELAKLLPGDPCAKRSFVASGNEPALSEIRKQYSARVRVSKRSPGALLRLIGLKLEDPANLKARSATIDNLEKRILAESQVSGYDENTSQWISRITEHRQMILSAFPEDIVSFHMTG